MNENREGTQFSPRETKDQTYCSVYGCSSRAAVNTTVRFHKFPRYGKHFVKKTNVFGEDEKIDRVEMWLDVLKLPKERLTPNTTVCSLHFKREDYILPDIPSKKKKLKTTAIPSCNLPKVKKIERNGDCYYVEEGNELRKGKLVARIKNGNNKAMNEKPYKCDICPKSFTRNAYLANHKSKKHTKAKKELLKTESKVIITKTEIGKNTSSNSNSHESVVYIKNESFECNICSEIFSTNISLVEHKLIHTEGKEIKSEMFKPEFDADLEKLHTEICIKDEPINYEQLNSVDFNTSKIHCADIDIKKETLECDQNERMIFKNESEEINNCNNTFVAEREKDDFQKLLFNEVWIKCEPVSNDLI